MPLALSPISLQGQQVDVSNFISKQGNGSPHPGKKGGRFSNKVIYKKGPGGIIIF